MKKLKKFECDLRKSTFRRKDVLKKHSVRCGINSVPVPQKTTTNKSLTCETCQKVFEKTYNYNRHLESHSLTLLSCNKCRELFTREDKPEK